MPSYLLRDVDDATWQRFKDRAARDGHSLRWVLLRLVERYADDVASLYGDPDYVEVLNYGSKGAIRPAARLAKGKR